MVVVLSSRWEGHVIIQTPNWSQHLKKHKYKILDELEPRFYWKHHHVHDASLRNGVFEAYKLEANWYEMTLNY